VILKEIYWAGPVSKPRVTIIGVPPYGVVGLLPRARRIISRAPLLIGGRRLLDNFAFATGEKIAISNNLALIAETIRVNLDTRKVVVLASGDPDFFGIAHYLIEQLGKANIEIIPNVSSMQMAFALIKESWDDAALVSLHGREPANLAEVVSSHPKTAIFTDPVNTPDKIAGLLCSQGLNAYRAYVCQNLGSGSQKIIQTDLETLQNTPCSALNVLILIKNMAESGLEQDGQPLTGIPDEQFYQLKPRNGLLTKQEVRAVSLAKLQLEEDSLLWDIGAGSGSVSIEAAALCRKGRVWAVEKDAESVALIRQNLRKFKRFNVNVINGRAPAALDGLAAPSRVFIGGSDGCLPEILARVCARLSPHGRIVANTATFESLELVRDGLVANGFDFEIVQLNVSRSRAILSLTRLEPLNPVFVISGWRKA
jgi:precorrin-6Y C5,15-methyltransferase (decarboxylating)